MTPKKAKPFRFKKWPFPPAEVVRLAWVCSPYRTETSVPVHQWRMDVVFVNDHGESRTVKASWRQFPLLKMGQYYKGGALLEDEFQSVTQEIIMSKVNKPTLLRARSSFPVAFRTIEDPIIYDEYCWVWSGKGKKSKSYVIPVSVLIQSIFCQDSFLSEGILKESFLAGVKLEEMDRSVRVIFPEHFRLPKHESNRKNLVRLVARIMMDSSFEQAFKSVSNPVLNPPGQPLKCDLPALQAKMTVRVITDDKWVLIQEILAFTPKQRLAAKTIGYVHPLYPKRTGKKGGARNRSGSKKPKGYVVEGGDAPSTPAKVTNHFPLPPAASTDQWLPVENVGSEEDGWEYYYVQSGSGKNEALVNFNAVGPNAGAPQGTVVAPTASPSSDEPLLVAYPLEDWETERGDGLDDFRKLLSSLKKKHDNTEVKFYLGAKDLPGLVRPLKRPYAFASLQIPNRPVVWLIEFAIRPERPLSLLVVQGGGQIEKFMGVLNEILTLGLDPQYWWAKSKLEEIAHRLTLQIERLSHRKNWDRNLNDLIS